MLKRIDFGELRTDSWPKPDEMSRYFLAKPGQEWTYTGGSDSASLSLIGVDGTHGQDFNSRIDIDLTMWGHPQLGVLLYYSKLGGAYTDRFNSVGDMSKLDQWVRSLHDTPLPVGLFIPFRDAWPAVKDFMETEGELPKSIEWIAARDLPAGTFPDP